MQSSADIQDTVSQDSAHSSGSDVQAWSDSETTIKNKDQERIIQELKEEYESLTLMTYNAQSISLKIYPLIFSL